MTNKTYLVKIKPLGNYFFGSENTFSGIDKAKNSKIKNYLVRSRKYPQQTTLLGFLRYLLLLKENKLTGNSEDKKRLIGAKSFHGNEEGAPTDWGIINSISPLFLTKGNNKYLSAGMDNQYYTDENKKEEKEWVSLEQETKAQSKSNLAEGDVYYLGNYKPKQKFQPAWKNSNNEDFILPKDIFVESFQVGIKKSFKGKTENDAFYKQYLYRLKEGFSFAVYLKTNVDIVKPEKPIIAPFGADQSLFSVSFEDTEDFIFSNSEQKLTNGKTKITLLSDAYCKSDILKKCYLAITNSIDFRYLKTNVNTKRYYNISKKQHDTQKSEKLNLLERGSVLYAEFPEKIISELDAYPTFRNAGFNYYTIQSLTK